MIDLSYCELFVYTRFPFVVVVDLNSRRCRRLSRENTAGVVRSHRTKTKNMENLVI